MKYRVAGGAGHAAAAPAVSMEGSIEAHRRPAPMLRGVTWPCVPHKLMLDCTIPAAGHSAVMRSSPGCARGAIQTQVEATAPTL